MASERSSLQESSPRSVLAWGEKSADRLRLVCGSRWNRGYGALAVQLPWASIALMMRTLHCGILKEVTDMEEKINVEFTGEEFDLILKYMDAVEATTVQNAILNAISIALDDSDNK